MTIEDDPSEEFALMHAVFGIEDYRYYTGDEFISTDREKPSIFQNFLRVAVPAGFRVPDIKGVDRMLVGRPVPFGAEGFARTEATGYIDGKRFTGVFSVEYEVRLTHLPPQARGMFPGAFFIKSKDVFDLTLS